MDAHTSLSFLPAEPRSVEDTGLRLSFIADLVLKVMYIRGFLTGREIAETVKLPFQNIIDQALEYLRREHLTEVKGSSASGFGESAYQYVISEEGRARAREFMDQNQYSGPAPVTLETYTRSVLIQSLGAQNISHEMIQSALNHLVLPQELLDQLGPAINSAKSIFIFGHPGNGKTAIAESIGTMLPGAIFVPYATNIDGNVVKIFDSLHHRPLSETETTELGIHKGDRFDRRWVLVRRPLISVGGELGLDNLDLNFDPVTKYYEAPFQMKANGGMFLIDDFGRQQMRPRDLLNRWIVPLEKRIDYLTLATGRKIDVPFDALIVFSTNLNPSELVDEAFLRRIRYKIEIPDPDWDSYREIFQRVCNARGVAYSDDALRHVVIEYYLKTNRKARAVHPRDIVEELVDIAHYRNIKPELTTELLDLACQAYFLRG